MASGSSSVDHLRNKSKVTDGAQSDGMRNVVEHANVPEHVARQLNLTVSATVQELLECPVCLDAMYPPIHQCSNGHAVGSRCKPKLHNQCPTCRHRLGNIRYLALEKVGASLKLPCKYQSFGCAGIFPYYSKLNHEMQCAFEPCSCPYTRSECPAVGNIQYLVDHLKVEHNVDIHNGDTFYYKYLEPNPDEVENATYMLKVISCYGQYFCLHYESFHNGTDPVYLACLRFMGNDKDAKKYRFRFAFRGNRRKMACKEAINSIKQDHDKLHNNCDGIMIKENKEYFFSDGGSVERNLYVSGSILKVGDFTDSVSYV